jgi:hypothetical protein
MANKIDMLVLAIADCNGCFAPGTVSFELCNPLLMRSFAAPGKHETNVDGLRVFPSLISGLKAAGFDCALKISGKSRAGLKPTDKIENLLRVYGITNPGGVSKTISYLRRALKDQSVSKDTPLSYFLEPSVCPNTQPLAEASLRRP